VVVQINHLLESIGVDWLVKNFLHACFLGVLRGGLVPEGRDCNHRALALALELEDVFLLLHVGQPHSLRCDDLVAHLKPVYRFHPQVRQHQTEGSRAASLLELLLEHDDCGSAVFEQCWLDVKFGKLNLDRE
jgi:hypothetical protein